MATVLDVFKAARTHLDDDDAAIWTDPRLMPKLRVAHLEMQAKLRLNNVPVLTKATATLSVPASTVDLTLVSGYPSDLVEPMTLYERDPGQQDQDYAEMQECDFIPLISASTDIRYWSWQGEKILVLASTQAAEIMIRYVKSLTAPTAVNDPIGILFGELYLGYRVAALAAASPTGNKIYANRTMQLDVQANKFLEQVVAMATKNAQNLPARRRGYHRRYLAGNWLGE